MNIHTAIMWVEQKGGVKMRGTKKQIKWADEIRMRAKEMHEQNKAEKDKFTKEELEWEYRICDGEEAGEPPTPPACLVEPQEPLALVATGITRGRGEAYGWRRFALMLGAPLDPDEQNSDDAIKTWKYAKKRFREAGLDPEGWENWAVREIAEWHSWLPDPRKPRV
jgi:hypothetical protein